MNKRLEKRHKRQVSRAREKAKVSEPDVRTPEQIREAREASRPQSSRRDFMGLNSSAPTARTGGGPAVHSTAKTDV